MPFIPFSGFRENLINPTDKMPWYKGWSANLNKDTVVNGITLYDALENLVKPPKRFPDKPVRIPINGIYKGNAITGRIEQGTLTAGDTIRVVPRGLGQLESIQY